MGDLELEVEGTPGEENLSGGERVCLWPSRSDRLCRSVVSGGEAESFGAL